MCELFKQDVQYFMEPNNYYLKIESTTHTYNIFLTSVSFRKDVRV